MKKIKNKKKCLKFNKKKIDIILKTKINKNYEFYKLAHPICIIFVRFLDIILISLIPTLLILTMKYLNKNQLILFNILLIIITFFLFFIYFVIIPYFWDGKTIIKFFFKIKLVTSEKKLKLYVIFVHELFIVFLPWFIILLMNLITNIIFKVNLEELFIKINNNLFFLIIIRIILTIYFLWYIVLIFILFLSKNNQILFDHHFKLFNVKKKIIKKYINNINTKKYFILNNIFNNINFFINK